MVWYSPPEPPPFVRLAADPVRWRLLAELACGDHRVRELVELVDQPQNLVSYHLAKLREAGLVGARRSSFDGRDSYYHLDLKHCATSLAATGTALHPALHPGLDPGQHPARTEPTVSADGPPRRVLFLDTGDSVRSPMAEALLGLRAGERAVPAVPVVPAGAGSDPRPAHPDAVRVLREDYGVDIADRRPHDLDAVAGQRFDVVISLCDRVREIRPEFAGHHETMHWSIPDPATGMSVGAAAGYPAFQRTAAELDDRIRFLLPALELTRPGQSR
ncbi:MAG TPA: metalloregulator ArsR/SmtB family transcription factor [Pseudonocardiaceae bacterium]|nr:metalloregulator ArsR/SmtB family transcription factor [Pseudonocardiaceae bacterium]